MTLQTSGAISLANIQTEFGGANPIGMNEYYAGGTYVPAGTSGTNGAVPSSGQISFSQFYGTSNYLDSQVVTNGSYDSGGPYAFLFWGYAASILGGSGVGSISDGTSNLYSGASITELGLSWFSLDPPADRDISFKVSGNRSNSGWTKMTVGGVDYARTSATYSYDSGSNTTSWIWYSVGFINPFGSGTTTVIWT